MSKIFKRPFKTQQAHSVSNKDKKKLAARLQIFPQSLSNFILQGSDDADEELEIIKIVGSKVVLYQRADTPLLFSFDGDKPNSLLEPSLYTMFA